MKILFLFVIATYSTFNFACETKLNFKYLHGLELSKEQVMLATSENLEIKKYIVTNQTSDYSAKIVLSKGKDFQQAFEYFAKTSVSLYKKGRLVNYTYGEGKSYSNEQTAYTLDMFKLAIEKAVGHLPDCK